MNVIFL